MVLEHCDSFDTQTECETGVNFGIDAAVAEYVGVNHAGTQNFDPAFALAETAALTAAYEAGNVNFCGGFGEGEVVGTETDFGLFAEHTLSKHFQSTLQVAQGLKIADCGKFMRK